MDEVLCVDAKRQHRVCRPLLSLSSFSHSKNLFVSLYPLKVSLPVSEGPTSGIHDGTALTLVRCQTSDVACRTTTKGETMVKKRRTKYSSKMHQSLPLSLPPGHSSLLCNPSSRAWRKHLQCRDRLDVLINNAGVFDMSNKYVLRRGGRTAIRKKAPR